MSNAGQLVDVDESDGWNKYHKASRRLDMGEPFRRDAGYARVAPGAY